ncbi:hypothetical protein [Methylibium sp. Root1272]|uniref:hypothetical protein n=1 Tax=Methylibium sp. Root1272 TaxID=1736441 RepID=UPI0012E777FB|nr:hypothetical protein [Methylibium sp. Root1272]
MNTGPSLLLAAAVLTSGGCATDGAPPSKGAVKVTTADAVTGCAYIDDVVGTSGWYGLFATRGVENARGELLNRAQAAGATHVVWSAPSLTYGSTSVVGKAYRCN